MNNSPWLDFPRRSFPPLKDKKHFDTTIVGGGIAGISTLYFLLKNTDKTVALLEKNYIASGATGHNAGFLLNTMEIGTDDLLREFGEEKTRQGFKELDNGWNLLSEMLEVAHCSHEPTLPLGALGYTSIDQIVNALEEEPIDEQIGRGTWKYLIAKEIISMEMIPKKFHKNIDLVPQKQVLEALRLQDPVYVCASIPDNSTIKREIMNSALFCQEVAEYLLETYQGRFTIFENTNVQTVNLKPSGVIVTTVDGEIESDKVVLCTNAYTDFLILDNGTTITRIRDSITKIVGYMAGYFNDDKTNFATALSGADKRYHIDAYFYFYNGPFFKDRDKMFKVIGGPERKLTGNQQYDASEPYPLNVVKTYQQFIKNTFGEDRKDFDYLWHGLMGYTSNRVRWIGPNPKYPQLLYNLGCNGIGLLSSIVGGEKISKFIKGDILPPSFFDPI